MPERFVKTFRAFFVIWGKYEFLSAFLKNRFRAFKFCLNGFVARFKEALLILIFYILAMNSTNKKGRSKPPHIL